MGADEEVVDPGQVFSGQLGHVEVNQTFSHPAGSMAATVNKPKGGVPAIFLMNFNACLKLQKVSGNSG
jgi:hypothetical protein